MLTVQRRRREVPPTFDEANQALADAEATLTRWEAEAGEKAKASAVLAAELAEQQARAGDDLLDDAEFDALSAALAKTAERLAGMQAQQGLAAKAAEAALQRLTDARRDALRARAGVLRARAARLREVAATRQARTDKLVAELADWERCPFEPAMIRSSSGHDYPQRGLTENIRARAGWYDKQAQGLALSVDQEPAERVAAALAKPLPAETPAEAAALASVDRGDRDVVV